MKALIYSKEFTNIISTGDTEYQLRSRAFYSTCRNKEERDKWWFAEDDKKPQYIGGIIVDVSEELEHCLEHAPSLAVGNKLIESVYGLILTLNNSNTHYLESAVISSGELSVNGHVYAYEAKDCPSSIEGECDIEVVIKDENNQVIGRGRAGSNEREEGIVFSAKKLACDREVSLVREAAEKELGIHYSCFSYLD